jgi:hypothetical protein
MRPPRRGRLHAELAGMRSLARRIKTRIHSSIAYSRSAAWIPATLTVLVVGSFALVRLAHFDFDASVFVVAGDSFVDAEQAPADLAILEDSDGYDGQFFYRLALDPFTSEEVEFGIRLDAPGWRQQRLLYPLIVWIVSIGNPAAVPVLLIVVNLVGLGSIGWFGARVAMQMGRHALWGLLFSFYPGFLISLSRDLSEIVATAFLLLGILFVTRTRFLAAAIAFGAAVLTRETTLLVPLAAGGAALLGDESGHPSNRRARYLLVIPLCVYAGMQIVLWIHWGELPIARGRGQLGAPLGGILHFLRSDWLFQEAHPLRLAAFLFVPAVAVLAACAPSSTHAGRPIVLAWMAYVGLMLLLTAKIWVEDISFLRAYTECYVLGALLIVGAVRFGTALRLILGVALALTWLAIAIVRSGRI